VGDNIASVFGSKFLKTLLPVDIDLPYFNAKAQAIGYISRVGEGVGRSDNDRQFFYVNGRPVDVLNVRNANMCTRDHQTIGRFIIRSIS
jgi:DNA mismatch repair protein PMS2